MKSKLAQQLAEMWNKPGCSQTHHLCRWRFTSNVVGLTGEHLIVASRGRMVR